MTRRSECPRCGRPVLVNADGNLRMHYPDPARPESRRPGGLCDGSGALVSALLSEPDTSGSEGQADGL